MSRKIRKDKLPKAPDDEKERPDIFIKAKNPKQTDYLESLVHARCIIVTGCAGTGKTYLAASIAARKYADKEVRNIILTRANVPTGKSLGAFPGDVDEKMAVWLLPLTDVLQHHLQGLYSYGRKKKQIQFQPIETIRGRSFDNAYILVDEAQQLTVDELKAVVTRIGRGSTLVLMGDNTQRDVSSNGLGWLTALALKHNLPVEHHHFTSDDIVRSSLCAAFVKAFEAEENNG